MGNCCIIKCGGHIIQREESAKKTLITERTRKNEKVIGSCLLYDGTDTSVGFRLRELGQQKQ